MSEAITPLLMPRWGVDMTEGKIVRWLVDEGATVKSDSELVEVESEKVVAAVEAGVDSLLRRRLVPEGVMVPVGGLIGVLAQNDVTDAEIDAFVQTHATPEQNVTEAPSHDETVTVMGQSLRLRTLGKGDPPVLLVHGFGGDLRSWNMVQTELAKHRRVISFDLPAHGDSSKTITSTEPDFFRDIIIALMDALKLPKAHLIGHSWGGVLAQALATHQLQRVASLTLIGTVGHDAALDMSYLDDFLAASRRTEVKAVLKRLFADPVFVTREMVEQVLRYKRIEAVDTSLRHIAAISGETLRRAGRLPIPSVATQIIIGGEDQICPISESFTPPEGVALHVLDRVGHMPQLESASKVVALINAHIAAAAPISDK